MNYTFHISEQRKEVAKEYIALIKQFIKRKYDNSKHINCQFDLFYHNVKNLRKVKHHKIIIPLPSVAYIQLMVVILTYPDITF